MAGEKDLLKSGFRASGGGVGMPFAKSHFWSGFILPWIIALITTTARPIGAWFDQQNVGGNQ